MKSYGWARVASEVMDVYTEVIQARRSGPENLWDVFDEWGEARSFLDTVVAVGIGLVVWGVIKVWGWWKGVWVWEDPGLGEQAEDREGGGRGEGGVVAREVPQEVITPDEVSDVNTPVSTKGGKYRGKGMRKKRWGRGKNARRRAKSEAESEDIVAVSREEEELKPHPKEFALSPLAKEWVSTREDKFPSLTTVSSSFSEDAASLVEPGESINLATSKDAEIRWDPRISSGSVGGSFISARGYRNPRPFWWKSLMPPGSCRDGMECKDEKCVFFHE
jgi:hypothetical protein